MPITIIHHKQCLEHNPAEAHPESSQRIESLYKAFKESPITNHLHYLNAALGTKEQVLLAHSKQLYDSVVQATPLTGRHSIDADTILSPGSLNAALRGVGAACSGVDLIFTDSCDMVFCATRPPGHHSTHQQAMGFCLFNNIAIAALYAKQYYGLERIAVVDFDVHHGNGTEDILKNVEGMFYLSTHQSPLYPGSGEQLSNIPNNIFNIPLPAGLSDEDYQSAFTQIAIPALESFNPQLLLVSAGFDAHQDDPLAGLNLTEQSYEWLGQQLQSIASRYCQGKVISVLEGGYNLDVLGSSAIAYLRGLLKATH